MKNIVKLLFACLLILSCNNEVKEIPDPNPMETATYKCIIEEHKAQNINVKKVFQELQQIALQTGNLKDSSAKAYYDMFKLSDERSYFPLSKETVYFDAMAKIAHFPVNMYCRANLGLPDSLVSNSKLYRFNQTLTKEIQNTRSKGLQPNVASVIMKVYSLEDFENEYIKFFTLGFISYRNSIENRLYQTIPH
jgi:hypothetical protein